VRFQLFVLSGLVGLGAVAGCSRGSGRSADYEAAFDQFNQLYAQELEDAYLDPRMAEIEQRLEAVPKDSSDRQSADTLLLRIRSGRERAEAREEEFQAELEELRRAPDEPGLGQEGPEGQGPEVSEPSLEVAEAPDAGAAGPVPGMPLAELQSRFSDCFVEAEQLELVGRGLRPTWALRELALCRTRHPGFEDKLVVGEAERVLFVVPKSSVEIPGADAGVPARP
jgi:hypothetical protein